MKKLTCLVIEDEALLAEVLVDYIRQIPFLELQSVFADAITAVAWLEDHDADLIFADINLPKLKGIDFIKMFQHKSRFIITTAYHEYALQGYELNVVDYLMKPIDFPRFMQAVIKAMDFSHTAIATATADKELIKDSIFINVDKKRVKIYFSDIVYIEGKKEYVKIYLVNDSPLITRLQMGQIEELLNGEFLRIHRSYIIARKKVSSYNHSEVNLGTVVLPVGTNYRETLATLMEK